MIATLLFTLFIVTMLLGVRIGASLGLAGAAAIALANSDYGTALRHLKLVYALAPEREATRQMLGEVFAVR